MPEGDTIWKLAASLRPALAGRTLVDVRLRDVAGGEHLRGHEIAAVRAVGKHLLIEAGDHVLRSHLGMDGTWHSYAPGERWWRPEREAGAVLDLGDRVFVCFDLPSTDVTPIADLDRHPVLSRLGPDLCLDDADLDFGEILRRARAPDQAAREAAELLLDQRVAAGIGNVYKSELLFLHRIDPWAEVASLDDDLLDATYRDAARLLKKNLTTSRRITAPRFLRHPRDKTPGAGLWVYNRSRRPCRQCGAVVRQARQGELARLTYWCGACQTTGVRAARPAP